ncbi:Signal transduction histidine kinase [Salipaludibacillus aurantiacus]|uniref:histidine kinase n=2 Tax=Salipaludibacillus aurantiacus TaxID=1601833 RepID=A0A1H9U9I7_9BACI|nr:Signal transduction histidine kinase [Salipaludibacillus aurantiacus]
MRFWVWIGLLLITWGLGLMHGGGTLIDDPFRLAGSALFFSLYFLLPIFNNHKIGQTVLFSVGAVALTWAYWPETGWEANPYQLILVIMIMGEAVYRLRPWQMAAVGGVFAAGLALPVAAGLPAHPPAFLLLLTLLITAGSVYFYQHLSRERQMSEQHEALLIEFRKLKRSAAAGEAAVRREERTQIARDIHDSVGHKLTALLMQLEVFRLQASDTHKEGVSELKRLAKDSLEETRRAVKTLNKEETGGLPAIIRLIRKLEAESFLRVHFGIKHGALTAPLRNDQAIAVYRAVQEALTNMMRHSGTKEAEVIFEVPGGSVFRFEVSHRTTNDEPLKEGFGIKAMRERVEQAGGELDVLKHSGSFIVRGTLPLYKKEGGSND